MKAIAFHSLTKESRWVTSVPRLVAKSEKL
jgi:hypothetical protein